MENTLLSLFIKCFRKDPKPFNEGFLPVGDGHEIHYMEFGNPKGIPVLQFHGGPGGSCRPAQASAYDLSAYHIILFSQRGCGQSRYTDLLKNNTSYEAVSDAEKLLALLVPNQKIIVAGGSYGSTLALLFAEKNPKLVKALVLKSVFLARKADLDWADETSALFYPDLMAEMKSVLKPKENLLDGYARLLFSGNYEQMKTAMQYYGAYERCLGKVNPAFKPVTALYDNSVNSLKIALEYERNGMFLKENELLKNIGKIKHIPTLIVHNRLDMTCPVSQAYDLYRAMDNAELKIVPDIGHGSKKLSCLSKKYIHAFLKSLPM